MAERIQGHDAEERHTFALVFLITFVLVGLVFAWLLYAQIAQMVLRQGQCTVTSSHLQSAAVDDSTGATTNATYAVTFTVSLLTADGQRLAAPAFYGSANYSFPDQKSARAVLQRYAVGSTAACAYTYLDFSGTKALFSPAVETEGLFFPLFFLLVCLVISALCVVLLRKRPGVPNQPAEEEASVPSGTALNR